MKNIFNILSFSLIALQSLAAIDLHTDKSCEQLKTAIEQALPLEKVQEVWQEITNTGRSQSELIELALEAIDYSNDRKNNLSNPFELLNGNSPALASHFKCYMIDAMACQLLTLGLCWYLGKKYHFIGKGHNTVSWLLIPDMMLLKSIVAPKGTQGATPHETIKMVNDAIKKYGYPCLAILRSILIPYFLYKAVCNGTAHKKLLAQKKSNLDATIAYLQTQLINNQQMELS